MKLVMFNALSGTFTPSARILVVAGMRLPWGMGTCCSATSQSNHLFKGSHEEAKANWPWPVNLVYLDATYN